MRWKQALAAILVFVSGCVARPSAVPTTSLSPQPSATGRAAASTLGPGASGSGSPAPIRVTEVIDLGDAPPWQLAADERFLWVLAKPTPTRIAILRIELHGLTWDLQRLDLDARGWDIASDGRSVWLGTDGDGKVLRIDPDSLKVVASVGGPGDPLGPYIDTGFGFVWTADSDERSGANHVSMVGPEGTEVLKRILVGRSPQAIAAGEGGVWVANHDDGSVSRIDPGRGETVENTFLQLTASARGAAHGITVGDGFVWAMMSHDGRVIPIDAQTGRELSPVSVGINPLDGVVSDHRVWIGPSVFDEDKRRVTVMDSTTQAVLGSLDVGAKCCFGLAAGFGSVWVGTRSPSQLLRLEESPPGS